MPADSPGMHVTRLSLACFTAAAIALVATVWLIDSDGSSEAERRLQRAASSPQTGTTSPERARAGKSGDAQTSGEAGRARSGSLQEVPQAGRRVPDAQLDRLASVSPSDRAAGTVSGGVKEPDQASAHAMTASDIEQRWRRGDPDDQAAAIDGLNDLPDWALAVDVVQQMIAPERLAWNDPAWDALDTLDPQLKVDAGAEMLFSAEPGRSTALRLIAGDRWPHAQQALGELLATTDANYQSHGDLVADGMQSIGEGARPMSVLRELKRDIRSPY